jgi:thiol-disulfide isomerase/thioredoxin
MISRADFGKSLPAFQLIILHGLSIESKALAGRVLIQNFWATWCGPCKDEMSSMERLRQKFSPDQLQFLAVTIENRPQETFWQQLELQLTEFRNRTASNGTIAEWFYATELVATVNIPPLSRPVPLPKIQYSRRKALC